MQSNESSSEKRKERENDDVPSNPNKSIKLDDTCWLENMEQQDDPDAYFLLGLYYR